MKNNKYSRVEKRFGFITLIAPVILKSYANVPNRICYVKWKYR